MVQKRSETPAAIEGKEILIVGQDIKPEGIPKKLKNGDTVFIVKVKRRGSGTIIKESNPKECCFKPYSMLEKGSRISGNSLWGFTSNPLMPGSVKHGGRGRTHKHSGQELTLTGHCFLEIILGWLGSSLSIHPQEELLS